MLSKDARVVPALLQFLNAAPDAAVRQLAGVLVRKRITVHWIKQAPELQLAIKHVLLERIVAEPECVPSAPLPTPPGRLPGHTTFTDSQRRSRRLRLRFHSVPRAPV